MAVNLSDVVLGADEREELLVTEEVESSKLGSLLCKIVPELHIQLFELIDEYFEIRDFFFIEIMQKESRLLVLVVIHPLNKLML